MKRHASEAGTEHAYRVKSAALMREKKAHQLLALHHRQDEALAARAARVTAETQTYIAGFFDGDGHIGIKHDRRNDTFRLVLNVYQSYNEGEPPELIHIQKFVAGIIRCIREPTEKVRRMWVMEIRDRLEQLVLITIVSTHGIVKQEQAQLALQFLLKKLAGWEARVKIRSARGATKSLAPAQDRLSAAYLSGILAAEGYVELNRDSLRIKISQNCAPLLLVAFRRKYRGNCSAKVWWISSEPAMEFAALVLPYLVGQKRPQLELACEFVRRKKALGWSKFSAEKKAYREEVKQKIRKMKKL